MQFTTVRCQEKDYDIYLKSEKLVHSLQEHEKYVSKLFGIGKNWILAISSLKITVAAIWREKKVDPCYLETKKCSSQLLGAVAAIWREKKVDPYNMETKKCSSQLLGARKKIITSI